MMTTRRWSTAATVALLATALLAACTHQPDAPRIATLTASSTVTPTPTATPTPTLDPEVAAAQGAILDVYQRFWAATVAVLSAPALEPSREIEDFAYGDALGHVYTDVLTYWNNGIAMQGQPKLSPVVSDIMLGERGMATITDCVDVTDWQPVYTATGKSAAAPDQATRSLTTSTASVIDGRWMITNSVVDRATPC